MATCERSATFSSRYMMTLLRDTNDADVLAWLCWQHFRTRLYVAAECTIAHHAIVL